MRGAEHVARIGREEVHTCFLWSNLRERDNVEDLDFYERIILKWFFKKRDGEAQTVSIGPSIGTDGGLL